ncbi:hypothetical protein O988_07598 [Pseudogymnoascus sp. VKM F-3808]|nr:hypothetical protein O988_07598 [Pseudogymnoascus sp. VKM F-3808]
MLFAQTPGSGFMGMVTAHGSSEKGMTRHGFLGWADIRGKGGYVVLYPAPSPASSHYTYKQRAEAYHYLQPDPEYENGAPSTIISKASILRHNIGERIHDFIGVWNFLLPSVLIEGEWESQGERIWEWDLEGNWEKQIKMENIKDDEENSAIRTPAATEEEEQPLHVFIGRSSSPIIFPCPDCQRNLSHPPSQLALNPREPTCRHSSEPGGETASDRSELNADSRASYPRNAQYYAVRQKNLPLYTQPQSRHQ